MYHEIYFIDTEHCLELLNIAQEFFVDKTKKTLDDNEDKNIHGTEYDLTTCAGTNRIKTIVEEIASMLYDKQLVCYNYWVSISEPNSIVISHDHMDVSDNEISAVLYLQADQNCGKLNLEYYNQELTPDVGRIIFFPSYCKHSVTVNQSSRDRICIAFDLKLNI